MENVLIPDNLTLKFAPDAILIVEKYQKNFCGPLRRLGDVSMLEMMGEFLSKFIPEQEGIYMILVQRGTLDVQVIKINPMKSLD